MKLLSEPLPFSFNWADRFEGTLQEKGLTSLTAARLILENPPAWVSFLMRLRNCVVRWFGLKIVQLSAGESAGGFPIIASTSDRTVMGFDDHHLDFRIVIDVEAHDSNPTISVTTLVNRKNWLGWVYMMFVAPIHRRIVPATLKKVSRGIHKVTIGR
jgi:hypothetical protein